MKKLILFGTVAAGMIAGFLVLSVNVKHKGDMFQLIKSKSLFKNHGQPPPEIPQEESGSFLFI